jgi:hypothetical protein
MPTAECKRVNRHTWEIKDFIYIYFESIISKPHKYNCAIIEETPMGEG